MENKNALIFDKNVYFMTRKLHYQHKLDKNKKTAIINILIVCKVNYGKE